MSIDTLSSFFGMITGSIINTVIIMVFLKNFVTKSEIADLIASIKELTIAQRDIAGILIRLGILDDNFQKIENKLDFLQINGCHTNHKSRDCKFTKGNDNEY